MSYRDKNEKLNAEAVAVDIEAQDPAMEVCLRCGQTFDTRILSEVHHHAQPTHAPLAAGQAGDEHADQASGRPDADLGEDRSGYREGTFDQTKLSNGADTGVDGS